MHGVCPSMPTANDIRRREDNLYFEAHLGQSLADFKHEQAHRKRGALSSYCSTNDHRHSQTVCLRNITIMGALPMFCLLDSFCEDLLPLASLWESTRMVFFPRLCDDLCVTELKRGYCNHVHLFASISIDMPSICASAPNVRAAFFCLVGGGCPCSIYPVRMQGSFYGR